MRFGIYGEWQFDDNGDMVPGNDPLEVIEAKDLADFVDNVLPKHPNLIGFQYCLSELMEGDEEGIIFVEVPWGSQMEYKFIQMEDSK